MLKNILLIIISLTIFSCSSSYQTQNQVASGSYLQLEGNFSDCVMVIDKQTIELKNVKTFTENGGRVARFPLEEGKHELAIYREKELILNQLFYTANNDTFRVLVP